MNTQEEIVLEDERALLRPLQASDIKHLIQFALEQPELWEYSLISAAGETGMANYIEQALNDREKGISYPFIVFDKLSQAYAGSTRYYDIQPLHKTCQLGYTWYGKQYQRSGLNRHCKYLLLRHAFVTEGLARVEFRADLNNARSIAAMKAIGCVEEGVLRSNCAAEEGRRDSIVLSILSDEWQNSVEKKLKAMLEV